MSPLSDKAIAVLRTLVFGAWSAGLAWLLTKFAIPAVLEVHLDALGQTVLVWLLMAVLYPLLQRVEAKLPPWLTRILLGSNKTPTYIDQAGNVLPPGPRFLGTTTLGTTTVRVSVDPQALGKEIRRIVREDWRRGDDGEAYGATPDA